MLAKFATDVSSKRSIAIGKNSMNRNTNFMRLNSIHYHGGKSIARRALSTKSAESIENEFIVPTYAKEGVRTREGFVISHGKGNYLYDTKDNKYLDLAAGIAVNCLGHGNTKYVDAVTSQMEKLVHVSNLYHTNPGLETAEKLIQLSPGFQKVFFCNSGTEANEGAIKFSRVYANEKRKQAESHGKLDRLPDKRRFIAFKGGFHGRSLGSLSVTWKPGIREPFQPLLMDDVTFLPYNDIRAVEQAIDSDVCAVIVEPVQGEGGITPATVEFMQGLRGLCDTYGASLICDEVQLGLGRGGNGNMYAHQEYGVVPDFMSLAKPLAGGLPMGAVLVSENVCKNVPNDAWLGTHGTTFGANPLVCSAANVVLDTIGEGNFLTNVERSGEVLIKGLRHLEAKYPKRIKQVRCPVGDKALYAGIQLHEPKTNDVIQAGIDRGILLIGAGDNGDVIRICPPLTLSIDDVEAALVAIEEAIVEAVPEYNQIESSKTVDGNIPVEYPTWPESFASKQEYFQFLHSVGSLPEGFSVGTAPLKFRPKELGEDAPEMDMKMSIINLDTPTADYAAVFTQNAFPGAPVKVGKQLIADKRKLGGIVINNKISNVHPIGGGVGDAHDICAMVKEQLNIDDSNVAVLPSSTGVIGWQLPVKEMMDNVENVVANLQTDSAVPAAEAIMTTDSFPKLRSAKIKLPNGEVGNVVGIAKGAGMVEPNLATMLVFILTDMSFENGSTFLKESLTQAVNAPASFNRISVDADQSTSDTIVVASSGKINVDNNTMVESAFQEALTTVCKQLSSDVVRNGEGTQHVMAVHVEGAPNETIAHGAAKAIVNSPLVKTAVAGNDPNVGRILAALGSYLGRVDPRLAAQAKSISSIHIGDYTVFEDGEFALDGEKEAQLVHYLKEAQLYDGSQGEPAPGFPKHFNQVDIVIKLNSGSDSSTVIGSDLTHDYVTCNAEYRS